MNGTAQLVDDDGSGDGGPMGLGKGTHSYTADITTSKSDYATIYHPAPPLASSRYNRQMLIPSISLTGQQKISASRMLVVGIGGLGSPAALYLAGADVGKLGLLDNDVVEVSNLHRQVVHREDSVRQEMTKVQSAIRGCRELNSEIEIVGYEKRLDVSSRESAEEVFRLMEGYDIVLDCTDNPATRYLISDLCVLTGKVLVSGAAQRLEGQMTVLNYELGDGARGPCYRCVFPTPPSPEMVKGCGEIGILGPVVGTIGTLMATEALRIVVRGVEEGRRPSMLMYSAWATDPRGLFRSFGLKGRRTDCVSCGDDEILKEKGSNKVSRDDLLNGMVDYITFCGVADDIKLLKDEQRVSAEEILQVLGLEHGSRRGTQSAHKWKRPTVIDTREPHEIEMGPRLVSGINIPISKILRQDAARAEMDALLEDGEHDAVVFVCQRGNDSQIAAKRLLDWREEKGNLTRLSDSTSNGQREFGSQKIFIGDVRGGYLALDQVESAR